MSIRSDYLYYVYQQAHKQCLLTMSPGTWSWDKLVLILSAYNYDDIPSFFINTVSTMSIPCMFGQCRRQILIRLIKSRSATNFLWLSLILAFFITDRTFCFFSRFSGGHCFVMEWRGPAKCLVSSSILEKLPVSHLVFCNFICFRWERMVLITDDNM